MHPRPRQASPYLLNISWPLSLASFSAKHQKSRFLQMWNLLERKEKNPHRRKKRRSHQRSRKSPSHHVEATRENRDPRALHLGRDHAPGRSGGGVCLRWLTYLQIIYLKFRSMILYMTSIHQVAPWTLPVFIHLSSVHLPPVCILLDCV